MALDAMDKSICAVLGSELFQGKKHGGFDNVRIAYAVSLKGVVCCDLILTCFSLIICADTN